MGLELIKLILNHPDFEIGYLATTQGSEKLSKLHPALYGVVEVDIEKVNIDEIANSCDLAFLALPHKTAMGVAKELLKRGVKVVDLSADYRLELEAYEKAYCPHEDRENLTHSVYGLIEFHRDKIKEASLVASPGCYPTVHFLEYYLLSHILIAIFPLLIDGKEWS